MLLLRLTADKRKIKDFPKLPSATSFIRKTLWIIASNEPSMNRKEFIKGMVGIALLTGLSKFLNPYSFKSLDKIKEKIDRKQSAGRLFEVDTSEESTEGGVIKYFYENDILKKIEVYQYGETGKFEIELFFNYGHLVRGIERRYKYNVPFYIDQQKADEIGIPEGFNPEKTKINIIESYFHKYKLSKMTENGVDCIAKSGPILAFYEKCIKRCTIILDSKIRINPPRLLA